MKKEKPMTTPRANARTHKVFQTLELVDKIKAKVATLKHGYIADDEFAELKKLIVKIK